MLNETDNQRFNHAYSKFEAGEDSQALQELRDLAKGIVEPMDKAALHYHETLFLEDMGRIAEARLTLEELKRVLAAIVESPTDSEEFNVRTTLSAMVQHAELRVTIAEGKEVDAHALLEDLVSRYPKQLRTAECLTIFNEVTTLRGLLLADVGQWAEARPLLEQANPPDGAKSQILYYLGHCYYQFLEYERARDKLVEALNLGLDRRWESMAHYILGLVYYRLSDLKAAKSQFELCLKTADPAYLDKTKIWEWLEAASRGLGLQEDAEKYKRMRAGMPRTLKPN
ncbi:MAG TPA: hypothetical protein VHS29_14120 [Candidatus Acidoferrales bacterium]|jgi:tetratricopeptide (TPR) repeat protein|nr:hypothetical protein [Candidatus Acidoferrales bacterium]